MPRGHASKRETKKTKKKAAKPVAILPPSLVPSDVEVIRKKRKPPEEDL
jgi:hypothetical protein